MQRVVIFHDIHFQGVSDKVNAWLLENSEKICIIDRLLAQSADGLTIAIFYTDKH